MTIARRAMAALTCAAFLTGCFGYNHSAKKWAYVGDVLLILGGGAAMGADLATRPKPCMDGVIPGTDGCPLYTAPVSGGTVVGAVLLAAGLFGLVFNATRPTVKTSR